MKTSSSNILIDVSFLENYISVLIFFLSSYQFHLFYKLSSTTFRTLDFFSFLSDFLYQEDLHAKLLLRLLFQLCVFITFLSFLLPGSFLHPDASWSLPYIVPFSPSLLSLPPTPPPIMNFPLFCFQLPHDYNSLKANSRESRMWRRSKWRL